MASAIQQDLVRFTRQLDSPLLPKLQSRCGWKMEVSRSRNGVSCASYSLGNLRHLPDQ